jgi:hypothetical protein
MTSLVPAPTGRDLVMAVCQASQTKNTARAYQTALDRFIQWHRDNGSPALSRQVVHAYRAKAD